MRLKTLTMAQVRGFTESVTIEFDDQLTLIIGENGAGKSTVLDSLRVLLSQSMTAFVKKPPKKKLFSESDVASGWPYLRAKSVLQTVPERAAIHCDAQKYLAKFTPRQLPDGKPYDQVVDNKDQYAVGFDAVGPPHMEPVEDKPPLFVFYSAHRSHALDRGNKKGKEAGGAAAAYTAALDDRYLELGTQAWLWHAEQSLFESDNVPMRVNASIERMLGRFLGDFENLRTIIKDDAPRLVVDKNGITLDIAQLSDGERGVLALLLDLTRRLGQVHGKSKTPENEPAIVMIDELDLHLHPRWQRRIARLLLESFPNVQFIATTHSPQIVGEVAPNRIRQVLPSHEIVRPNQSLGLDSSTVLREIMNSLDQNPKVEQLFEKANAALDSGDIKTARSVLNEMSAYQSGPTPDTAELESTINTLEAMADEDH